MHRPLAGCLLRVPCLAARVPVEAVKKAHKCAAWSTVFWTLVHVVGHYRNFSLLAALPVRAVLANMGLEACIGHPESNSQCWTLPPAALRVAPPATNATASSSGPAPTDQLRISAAEWLLESMPGATGHAMLAAILVAVPLAACLAVRVRCHELFSRSHMVLFVVMAVCLGLHGQGSWLDASRWYVMVVPCLLVMARMAAQWCLPLTQQAVVVSAIVDDSGVARLELVIRQSACFRGTARATGLGLPWALDSAQHRPLGALPGQFVLLRLPSLSGLEWHPFSVSSASTDDVLVLHVRPQGDLTRRIVEELCLSADEVDAGARVVHLATPRGADASVWPCWCFGSWSAHACCRPCRGSTPGDAHDSAAASVTELAAFPAAIAPARRPGASRRIVVRTKSFRQVGHLRASSDLVGRTLSGVSAAPLAPSPATPAAGSARAASGVASSANRSTLAAKPRHHEPGARKWRPVPVQLAGPFSAGAQLCLSSAFEDGGVFLAAAGVGATPFVSALRELHAAYDGQTLPVGGGLRPNKPAWLPHSIWHGAARLPKHVTFVWVVPTVAKAAWGLPTLRDVVTSYATRTKVRIVLHVTQEPSPPHCITFSTRNMEAETPSVVNDSGAAAAAIGLAAAPPLAHECASDAPRPPSARRSSEAAMREASAVRHRTGSVLGALGAGAVFDRAASGRFLPAAGDVIHEEVGGGVVPLGELPGDEQEDVPDETSAAAARASDRHELLQHRQTGPPHPPANSKAGSGHPGSGPAEGRCDRKPVSRASRVRAARDSKVSTVEGRIEIQAGRPKWEALLLEEKHRAASLLGVDTRASVTIGVFACGPPPMAKQLAKACRALSDEEACECGFRSRTATTMSARRPSGMLSTTGSRRPGLGQSALVANPLTAGSPAASPSSMGPIDGARLVRFTLVKERFW